MMWIVRLALRQRWTFIVMALMILLLGVTTILRTPTDILPEINIPVVSMIWSYAGMSATDMAQRITTLNERVATTVITNIEHIESQSMPGVCVIRFYLQPGADAQAAVAQLTSISQTILRGLPLGTTSPLIIQYNTSSVPILQLALSSDTLTETQLYDYGGNFVRPQIATIRGAAIATPYGGKQRSVMVDLNIQEMQSKGLTPNDVVNAVSAQNLVLPGGTEKIGKTEFSVFLNNSPSVAAGIGDLPIKAVNGAMVYIRDVAQVRDGFSVQNNIVNINGRRSVLLSVLKNGDASTLAVVGLIKAALPKIQATLPKSLKITPMFDQSVFVAGAISGVVTEAIIAACLTAIMILVFLGSWKSTLIVATSIPLAILTSICCLGFLGESLNEMTLGGLALAVGILVDDATVEIENIHRNMALERRGLKQVILDGAEQIANPTFVSSLAICIVFVSVVFLTGASKFLFTPMALAVVFAMLASYLLSRTVVPVMALLLLKDEVERYQEDEATSKGDIFWRIHQAFDRQFNKLKDWYARMLRGMLNHRPATITAFCAFFVISLFLFPFIGEDFFPTVDAGLLQLHARAPSGTRIEDTADYFYRVETAIRKIIPVKELGAMVDNIGLPPGGINLAFGDSATIGSADGQIMISLNTGHHPSAGYEVAIRKALSQQFPDGTFFFQSADIESQVLNSGLPAPLDIQVVGADPKNYGIAQSILRQVQRAPGAEDAYIQQIVDAPSYNVNVDRDRALQLKLQQKDVASSVLTSLSSSTQTSPGFWLDPVNGVSYNVVVQTPQYKMDSLGALNNTPINATGTPMELLSNVATVARSYTAQVVNHYNVQQTFDVYASTGNRDLGGLTADVQTVLAKVKKSLPRGTTTVIRGQAQSMNEAFSGLEFGIVFAIVLVYALMVVNFQTWRDPLIIVGALPGALSGILWMLFLTSTHISVPALMGTIMCIGVAVANSILVLTFANDRRLEGDDATEAAYQAGVIRLRPVMMTALAMIIGMMPMALGLGDGGEQNAPLGRAVLGGLIVATTTTLFLVPVLYSLLRKKQPVAEEPDAAPEAAPTAAKPAESAGT